MATNITPEQRDGILKVVVGLFNAAPGGTYLNDLATAVQAGMTQQQLADYLSNHTIFISQILGGRVTTADKVDLLMKNFGLTANSDAASAGSQAKAYFEAKLNAGDSIGKVVVDATTYLSGTVAPEFETTKNLFLNKVAVAAPFSLSSNSTSVSVLQNSLSEVKGDHLYTTGEAQTIADAASANTLAFTTGTDQLIGTSGNDTFVGDVSTTVGVSDQVSGGGGTDTLKLLGDFTAATNLLPSSLTGVEILNIAKFANADQNLSSYTKATTGIEKIMVGDASLLTGKTITTSTGQELSLATANGAATAGTVTWAGAAADTSLNLTLNGYQSDAAPKDLTITGAAATTLNIKSTGSDNEIGTLTGPATVTKHVITGDKQVSYNMAAADAAAVKTVDASASTGGAQVDASAGMINAAFAFTGGSGNDMVSLKNDAFGTLTAGTQLDGGAGTDKLGLFDTALTSAEAGKINAVKNFESLSLNAAITLDASAVSNFKTFDIDTTALTQTISNMATGSTVNVGSGATAAFTQTALTVGGAVGVTDATINLGGSGDEVAHTITALTTTGLTNLKISSNGTAANTITAMTNSDNTTFTLSGSADLTMAIKAGASVGSIIDASAMTGKATLTGSDVADIIKGGSGADTLKAGKGSDTLTGGAGADTFVFSGTAGATTSGTLGNFDEIKDFVAGTDKLQFSGVADVVSGQQSAVQTAVTALSAGSTSAQILTAMATANTTALGVSFAVFEGSTYVLYETTAAGTGVAADDVFIKLTGVTTLPTFSADVTA
ncbi:MAG: hypothetical protein LM517_08570 [Nitrosomonas sp.]|nr:hypothetical protein [Nitrosomonas sp.]